MIKRQIWMMFTSLVPITLREILTQPKKLEFNASLEEGNISSFLFLLKDFRLKHSGSTSVLSTAILKLPMR